METTSVYVDNQFNNEDSLVLSTQVIEQAKSATNEWYRRVNRFTKSFVVALDCVVSEDQLNVISFDNLPKGVDIISTHNKKMLSGSVKSVKHELSHNYFSPSTFPELTEENYFEAQYQEHINGNPLFIFNHYGEGWLWNRVDVSDYEGVLDPNGGFVLKEIGGRRVYICPPSNQYNRFNKSGIRHINTYQQMLRILELNRSMYYQKYIEPMVSPEGLPMIYSLYFDLKECEPQYMGGLAIVDNSLKVGLGNGSVVGVINH